MSDSKIDIKIEKNYNTSSVASTNIESFSCVICIEVKILIY